VSDATADGGAGPAPDGTPPAPDPYLVGLRLAGRRVVVVGGGAVAQRRVPGLLAAGADVTVVAPDLTPTLEPHVAAGTITWTDRGYAEGDLDGAWYALALTDDPAVNARVVADAESRRIFCVRADDGRAGTAVTPATGRQGPVSLAVLQPRQKYWHVRQMVVGLKKKVRT